MFDDARRKEARHDHVHNFREHTLRVTDVKSGHGGSNAVIISASEDQTCKVRYILSDINDNMLKKKMERSKISNDLRKSGVFPFVGVELGNRKIAAEHYIPVCY